MQSTLLLFVTFLSLTGCIKINNSSSSGSTKSPLSLATTKSWEEIGAMCVVDNADLYCWSSLGFSVDLNIQSNNTTPTKIEKLSGSAKQAAVYNMQRTCVVGSDTSLRCIGHGLSPDTVIFPSGVSKVDAGPSVICAIVNSALNKCWGSNPAGELGDGTFTQSSTPVDVLGMDSGVTDVSVGLSTVCAVKNGAAFCWGSNISGSIGDGTTNSSGVPVAIPTLSSGVTDISTSYGGYGEPGDSSFAVKNGGLYVWGQNDVGQLGDGTTVGKLTPTLLESFNNGVTQVDTGGIET